MIMEVKLVFHDDRESEQQEVGDLITCTDCAEWDTPNTTGPMTEGRRSVMTMFWSPARGSIHSTMLIKTVARYSDFQCGIKTFQYF